MVDSDRGPAAKTDPVALTRICQQALRAVGYTLVELEYQREAQGWVLRVFIDHPGGDDPVDRSVAPPRITHGDCQRASRQLSAVLDVEDPIAEAYSLEVSSPGVYRPVRQQRDFKRFSGFGVRVTMVEAVGGRKSFVGVIVSADGGVVTVEGEDGTLWSLPIEKIRKARLTEEY